MQTILFVQQHKMYYVLNKSITYDACKLHIIIYNALLETVYVISYYLNV